MSVFSKDKAATEAGADAKPSESLSSVLRNAVVVLKDTTHPGNIGATARAMKTMGLSRLVLAAAKTRLDSQSHAMAAGAVDILDAAKTVPDLDAALRGVECAFAFTARRRSDGDPPLSARTAGEEAARRMEGGATIALVFGGEQSGLCNEDVAMCRYAVEIPASPSYSSLNLAQSVQVAGYELRCALLALHTDGEEMSGGIPVRVPAEREHLAGLLAHAGRALGKLGIPRHPTGPPVLPRLRRLMMRAELDESEVNLLRGIFRAAEEAADKK